MVYLMRMLKLPTARHETIWREAAADGKPKFCGRRRNEMGPCAPLLFTGSSGFARGRHFYLREPWLVKAENRDFLLDRAQRGVGRTVKKRAPFTGSKQATSIAWALCA